MIHTWMGDFDERKVLSVGSGILFLFALLQSSTSVLQATVISAVTVIGVILLDMYLSDIEMSDRKYRCLLIWGGIASLGFFGMKLGFLFFILGAILLAIVGYRLYVYHKAEMGEKVVEEMLNLAVAIFFFVIWMFPAVFLIPVVIAMIKFVVIEWPGGKM